LYAPNRNGFLALSGDRIITVKYEFGSNNFFDEDRQISPGEVGTVIDKIKSTFDVVHANIKNTELSQAPSPTLRGNEALKSVGNTAVLDACELLSDQVATSSLNTEQLSPLVERRSIRKDPTVDTQTRKSLPSNLCLKRMASADHDTGYISLELQYAGSIDQASDAFDASVSQSASSKTTTDLVSNATKAKFVDFTRASTLVQFARFQNGPYVGTLTIAKQNADDDPIAIDKTTFATTLNKIIDRMPQ
jgi:hypothetical protein